MPVLYLSAYIANYKADYYRLIREVTENNKWMDWVSYMLTSVTETAQGTVDKITAILKLKGTTEPHAKAAMGSSDRRELLDLMFTMPYLKIELMIRQGIAHRETASSWLKKLADSGLVIPKKLGKTTYYINQPLMDILAGNA